MCKTHFQDVVEGCYGNLNGFWEVAMQLLGECYGQNLILLFVS